MRFPTLLKVIYVAQSIQLFYFNFHHSFVIKILIEYISLAQKHFD